MSINRRLGVPMVNGYEHDALTPFKRYVNWPAGARRAMKNSFNRRVRRQPIEMDEERSDAER